MSTGQVLISSKLLVRSLQGAGETTLGISLVTIVVTIRRYFGSESMIFKTFVLLAVNSST